VYNRLKRLEYDNGQFFAQQRALNNMPDLYIIVLLATVVVSVSLFVYSGICLFYSGWQGYEEKYGQSAERTLDSIYLTVPTQHIAYLSVVCFALATAFWFWLFGNIFAAVVFGLIGLAVPKILLWWLKKRRDKKFDYQLVDALTNIGNSLQAGFSLNQALGLVAREMDNPMGQEMGLVVRQMQVGMDMQDALENLYTRMPSRDLDLLITSIVISREVGGDLTEIFENIASTIQERHRIEGRIAALSAQGKMQGFVLVCIPPAMAVALNYIAPSLIEPLYTTVVGWMLMGVIAALMIAGIYTIYKIVDIEV